MKARIEYIIERYGMEQTQDQNGNYLQQGAPRVDDLKEVVSLIYQDRAKWPKLFRFCDTLDDCLFHNEACLALMDRMLEEVV
jgi:hypothetical protein